MMAKQRKPYDVVDTAPPAMQPGPPAHLAEAIWQAMAASQDTDNIPAYVCDCKTAVRVSPSDAAYEMENNTENLRVAIEEVRHAEGFLRRLELELGKQRERAPMPSHSQLYVDQVKLRRPAPLSAEAILSGPGRPAENREDPIQYTRDCVRAIVRAINERDGEGR
jgi:hypothetical protein